LKVPPLQPEGVLILVGPLPEVDQVTHATSKFPAVKLVAVEVKDVWPEVVPWPPVVWTYALAIIYIG
jgi:hypothetical protein